MSNVKAPAVEISSAHIAAVMDWLNRNSCDAGLSPMSRQDVEALERGDRLIMQEATMGEGADGAERIFAPGTSATFWLLEKFELPMGWAVTLIIGGQFDDEAAIVNCFYESDAAGFPFRRAEERG